MSLRYNQLKDKNIHGMCITHIISELGELDKPTLPWSQFSIFTLQLTYNNVFPIIDDTVTTVSKLSYLTRYILILCRIFGLLFSTCAHSDMSKWSPDLHYTCIDLLLVLSACHIFGGMYYVCIIISNVPYACAIDVIIVQYPNLCIVYSPRYRDRCILL